MLIGSGLPAWDWTEEMRDYFAREEAAFEAGDLDGATEVNLEFWVAPEHHDEVRPQQRLALELQSAHEEPEVHWPEMAPLSSLERCRCWSSSARRTRPTSSRSRSHLAEEIPGAELVTCPGAGHLVGVDQPDELNALLLEFLPRLDSGAPRAPHPTGAARPSIAQSPNGAVGEARRGRRPPPGSTQRNVPLRPKWPNVRAELRAPVQCGDLPSRSSKPSPQSFGFWRPKPGSTPSSPGNCTVVASASVSAGDPAGRLQLARERRECA